MRNQHIGRIVSIVALAMVLATGLSVFAFAPASPLAQQHVAHAAPLADPGNCLDYRPPDVPVSSCWRVTDTIETGLGTNIACISDDNPLGYYRTYTTYYGWDYEDAYGNMYTDTDTNGNPFPYSLVGSYNSYDCGAE